jgi:hypothetical protein
MTAAAHKQARTSGSRRHNAAKGSRSGAERTIVENRSGVWPERDWAVLVRPYFLGLLDCLNAPPLHRV